MTALSPRMESSSSPLLMVFGLILITALAFALVGAVVSMPAMPRAIPQTQLQVQRVQQVTVNVPSWLAGEQTTLREGLTIHGHAAKHQAQAMNAWQLQTMLSNGQCVASRQWCGTGSEELYICVDPVTGLIGGLIVVGDRIISGYAGSEGYWRGKVLGDEWGACDGRHYE